jgi:hypothetical protein
LSKFIEGLLSAVCAIVLQRFWGIVIDPKAGDVSVDSVEP